MSKSAQSIYQAFEETATQFPARDFLHLVQDTARRYEQPAGSINYAAVLREVQQLFAGYAQLKLQPGSRVALALDNRPEFFYHWLALNALGVAVVPLNPQWRAAELEYVFEHSEAGHVICLADRVALLESVSRSLQRPFSVLRADGWHSGTPLAVDMAVETAEQMPLNEVTGAPTAAIEDEAALLYTSGTTGKPKGCRLSNEYFLVSGAWYRDLGGHCELSEGGDRLITPLPMYHMNAMATSTMAMLMTGGCVVPLDRFHPSSFWQSVSESEASILHYLGVMPVMLMGMQPDPQERNHKLRFGFGAGLGGELHTQFEDRFGFRLIEAWAMTETGCGVAIVANREPRKVGTACFGRAGDHIDYRLVDDCGDDVQPGEAGELLVRQRGANPQRGFFSGYLKNQTATDEAWQDGFFHTGDLIRADADGSLHFVDRKKNIIRRSGENISAVEVEEAILEHPQVLAVGVAPVADEIRGDEVFACVVSDVDSVNWPQLTQEIVQHCLGRLAYYKAPGYVARCEALPLTPTEKIQRMQLKALAHELLGQAGCVDTRTLKKPAS